MTSAICDIKSSWVGRKGAWQPWVNSWFYRSFWLKFQCSPISLALSTDFPGNLPIFHPRVSNFSLQLNTNREALMQIILYAIVQAQ